MPFVGSAMSPSPVIPSMEDLPSSLLVATYKPPSISSNTFLSRLKKHFKQTKAGYLGTLDPFAKGVLVVGFGSYTRLFPHLQKSPKLYRATLWLGAQSRSLDIEGIESVRVVPSFSEFQIGQIADSLVGEIEYTPPIFSARHINGQRAYKLAREGKDFELPHSVMEIFSLEILNYNHPFVSFRVSVSEGAYVRSIGQIIAQRLGVCGVLSSLERLSEGEMSVGEKQGMKILNPFEYMPYPVLSNLEHLKEDMSNGKKVQIKTQQKGKHIVCFEDFFSIIEVFNDGKIQYILNRMPRC